MSWFLIALLASLCWSITNHIEKYILTKFFVSGGAGGYVIFAAFTNIIYVGALLAFKRTLQPVSLHDSLIMIASGVAYTVGVLFYLHALERDEASIVVPMFQTIPIFAFALGFLVLGETLTRNQLIGSAIIVLAAIALSLDLTLGKIQIKKSVLLLMLLASLFISLNWLLFKAGAITADYWTATFWQFIGSLAFGCVLYVAVPKYRREFMQIIRGNTGKIFAIDMISGVIDSTGNRLMAFAVLSVPIALAQVVNGFQPVFVFLIGIIITSFFPKLGKEKLSRRIIAQKVAALAIMLIGAYIIG